MFSGKIAKITAVVLTACLLLFGTAFAAVLGELINGYETYLGSGMELAKGVYWTGSDYRSENYIEYSPSSAVRPVVVSGSKLCNYGNFSSMASLLENKGMHVIAGINGDYFIVSTSEPCGIVVEDGRLLSSDGGLNAVGFKADGTAVFGKPALKMYYEIDGQKYILNGFNKARAAGEAVVCDSTYDTETANSTKGVDIICTASGGLTLNGEMTLTVQSVETDSYGHALAEGGAVLSFGNQVPEALMAIVKTLHQGQEIKVTCSSDSAWADVTYAVGSLYKLVTNGNVEAGLEATAAPRTAVGKKADGTLVFYTIDGRQTGLSVGTSMKQLAERMVELGCTEAAIMDGGGSTSLNAIYLGDSSVSQINSPSDGRQRSVSNYIMLVTTQQPTGTADRLAVYPLTAHVLDGASVSFAVKAADANGYSASVPSGTKLTVTDGLGQLSSDGVFTATGEGTGTITASCDGLTSAAVQITAVSTPDELKIISENTGKELTYISVPTGYDLPMTAKALKNHVSLTAKDENFTWSVTGNVGVLDESGHFIAGEDDAEGTLTVSAGGKSVTIPVTVTSPQTFDDVDPDDWYFDAVEKVSELGLMTGTGDDHFQPDKDLTRAEVVTVLYRAAGSPAVTAAESGYTDVSADAWYYGAVCWATEAGVAQGSEGRFAPDDRITREQLATMLFRWKKGDVVGDAISGYEDVSYVSAWAVDAFNWAVSGGIIKGMSDTLLGPKNLANRATLATIFARMYD